MTGEGAAADDPGFVAEWQDWLRHRGTGISLTLGIEAVSASDEHVEMALPFRPEIGQSKGVFAAGALIQLADSAATVLCRRLLHRRGEEGFPFAVQMDVHLLANAQDGRALARATMASAGRTLMVVRTTVTDEGGRELLLLTSTHLARSSARVG